jgi:predicted GIY-YIG superfamily endonuclease
VRVTGTVYLLHFARPYGHAQHYLGWASKLEQRLAQHRAGRGARLLEVITDAGIPWRLARTWSGPRALERRLKGWHSGRRLCSLCGAPVRPLSATPRRPNDQIRKESDPW